MAANMYRVGDYVFFETSSTTPYQIRRIEELNKTPNGNVEAKVMCFYRRRDISSSLIMLADKHQSVFDRDEDDDEEPPKKVEEEDKDITEDKSEKKAKDDTESTTVASKEPSKDCSENTNGSTNSNSSQNSSSKEELDDKQKHQLKHRELFLSRQVETLPATHIRGKCAVTLLNETESLLSYLNKEDTFFYSLVYDPGQKTLLADKGEIRVGSKFQAEPHKVKLIKEGEEYERKSEELETLVWQPESGLSNKQIDQFLVIARSVGTFARALDCTSTVRQPSLHMSAAAASRDITLFHAMDILHKHSYDLSAAIASMVPLSGPVLCRDEMEEWSASEANLFEEALEKYGKDFNDIRQDFLPWKSLKCIVEYYYMWKTTDRYVQQKRIKAAEAESKLKQVYIPNYNKPNPAQIQGGQLNGAGGRACESCFTTSSSQWYSWGPVHMQCRLCNSCWSYWKKYGGLKMPTRLVALFTDGVRPGPDNRTGQSDNVTSVSGGVSGQLERLAQMAALQRMHRCTIQGCGKEFRLKTHLARHLATAHGLAIRAGSPRPVMKTRAAFCLITTPLTRFSRQVCADILHINRAARQPFMPINIALIKQECQTRMTRTKPTPRPLKKRFRKSTDFLAVKVGIDIKIPTALLNRNNLAPEPTTYRFPPRKPEIKVVPASTTPPPNHGPHSKLMRNGGSAMEVDRNLTKRGYEQTNGLDGSPQAKRTHMAGGVIRQTGATTLLKQQNQQPRGSVISQMNGKVAFGKSSLFGKGKKNISWMDAPDDVFFVATDATRKLRKQMNSMDFRRAARKPWRKLNVKTPPFPDVITGDSTAVAIGRKGVVVLD